MKIKIKVYEQLTPDEITELVFSMGGNQHILNNPTYFVENYGLPHAATYRVSTI